jgi:hypothetical protein
VGGASGGGNHQDWNYAHCYTIKVFSLFMTLSRPDFRANKYPAAFSNFYDCLFQQLYQHPDSVDYLNAIFEHTISRVDLQGMFSKLILSSEEG